MYLSNRLTLFVPCGSELLVHSYPSFLQDVDSHSAAWRGLYAWFGLELLLFFGALQAVLSCLFPGFSPKRCGINHCGSVLKSVNSVATVHAINLSRLATGFTAATLGVQSFGSFRVLSGLGLQFTL